MSADAELVGLYWTVSGPVVVHFGREWSLFDWADRCAEARRVGFSGLGIWHSDLEHMLETRTLHELKQIFDDKKLQKEIKNAASNVRDASVALRESPKKSGGLSVKRVLVLGAIGGGVALAVSEGLRKKVLDTLFGAEEEFEYTSNTGSASSPQTTASPN